MREEDTQQCHAGRHDTWKKNSKRIKNDHQMFSVFQLALARDCTCFLISIWSCLKKGSCHHGRKRSGKRKAKNYFLRFEFCRQMEPSSILSNTQSAWVNFKNVRDQTKRQETFASKINQNGSQKHAGWLTRGHPKHSLESPSLSRHQLRTDCRDRWSNTHSHIAIEK